MNFLRVNTIFEVVKAADMKTAQSDKHPPFIISLIVRMLSTGAAETFILSFF